MNITQLPTPLSDAYIDARDLGKLQREIGENVVETIGVKEARQSLLEAQNQTPGA